ncbi:MAG: hypothetical protein MJZ81_07215 [Bacteroidales bacterium]|nr:hypothetical protein [Bacteroidales bacterium]
MIGLKCAMFWKRKGIIPSYCVPVDYIESTGKQFIKTGFILDTDFNLHIDLEFVSQSPEQDFVGSVGSINVNNAFVLGNYNNFVFLYCRRIERIDSSVYTGINRVKIDIGLYDNQTRKFLKINGQTIGDNTGSVLVDKNLHIFCSGSLGSSYYNASKIKLFELSVEKANGEKLNLIPVRNKIDGLGYLCDILTGNLYGTGGTDPFIIGPDKSTLLS